MTVATIPGNEWLCGVAVDVSEGSASVEGATRRSSYQPEKSGKEMKSRLLLVTTTMAVNSATIITSLLVRGGSVSFAFSTTVGGRGLQNTRLLKKSPRMVRKYNNQRS